METGQEVRLFVASSITELHDERMELGVFLDNLKTRYWKGLRLVYEICENNSPAANPKGKQSEYDDWIRDCQLFCFLVGKRLGKASRHEFDLAWDCLCQRGTPRILPFFKELPPEQREDSARDFLDYYRNELEQYSYPFSHIDTVKLSILLELRAGGWLDQPLTARDGALRLGEEPLLSTEHIPVYRSHEALRALRKREAELEARLEADARRDGEAEDFSRQLRQLDADAELVKTRAERRRIEAELLALCAAVLPSERDGSPATSRTLRARRLVEAGDAQGALALLRAGDPDGEARSAEAIVALGLDRIRALIGEDKLRIRLLRARPVSPEITAELRETYARSARLAERYDLEPELLYDYVRFLWEEKDYRSAIPLGERLRARYEREGAAPAERAELDNLLGILYAESKEFPRAKERQEAALTQCRLLAEADPEAHMPNLAANCNNLGALLDDLGERKEARRLYGEALEIRRRLAQAHPAAYEPDVAMTCNNLGNLLSDLGEREEARRLYGEALEIRRRLAQAHPAAYEPRVADTCNNLGNLLSDLGEREEARRLYGEALEIRRRLAQAHPAAYEPRVADTCNNLGNLLSDLGEREEARRLYGEALDLYRRLAQAHPAAYEPYVAMTCNNLGTLLKNLGEREAARRLYGEALEIRHRLAQAHPAAYEPDVAMSCNNLGALLSDLGEREEARRLYGEALDLYRRLAQAHPAAYAPDLAGTCFNLGLLERSEGHLSQAGALAAEAERLWRPYPQYADRAIRAKLLALILDQLDSTP